MSGVSKRENRKRGMCAITNSPGDEPVVMVRRRWNDRWRIAAYRISDISGLHWSKMSGGLMHRAPRHFLHGYVACDEKIGGKLAHSCKHGPPPHRIKVCITKKGNKAVFPALVKMEEAEYRQRSVLATETNEKSGLGGKPL
jgi:hypothetical protein